MRALLSAFLLLAGLCPAAAAGPVSLAARDGGLTLEAELVGFDGEFYEIDTQFGRMVVDAAAVRCTGDGCPDPADFVPAVTVSGAPEVGEVLLPALIEAFADRDDLTALRRIVDDRHFSYELVGGDAAPALRVTLRLTSSDEGFADLLADAADMVLSAREINAAERRLIGNHGLGDLAETRRFRVIALDGLVLATGRANPVDAIPLDSAVRLFAGDPMDWSAFGGVGRPVRPHLPDATSGVTQAFRDYLSVNHGLALSDAVERHGDIDALADEVAASSDALALLPYSALGNAKALRLTGPCGYPLAPTRATIKTEDYPLVAPLFLYLPERRVPRIVRDFLEFVQSPSAGLVVRRAGFVDQRPEGIPIDRQGVRFANAIRDAGDGIGLRDLQRMAGTLAGAERLTITFRFEAGSSALDTQSRANIGLLAQALRSGAFAGREILFVGFSDGIGEAQRNRELSERRAEAVLDAVRAGVGAQADDVRFAVHGFGEAMPMACDEVEWGQRVNRRVEVWVRQSSP